MSTPLLTAHGVKKTFTRGRHRVAAVDDVSVEVNRGEIFGILGQSGSGKSTFVRCLLRLIEPDDGSVTFDGVDLRSLRASQMRAMRRRMALVFQDPTMSLNPRLTVGQTVGEPLVVHGIGSTRADRRARVERLFAQVGLDPDALDRLPREFSGGQRQRINIARALAAEPDLVVLDEAVSALDVSVQAQVLNLLLDLRDELGITMIFVSHDIDVVRYVSDRVLVMQSGAVREQGPAETVLQNPTSEYTQLLLRSSAHVVPPSLRSADDAPRAERRE